MTGILWVWLNFTGVECIRIGDIEEVKKLAVQLRFTKCVALVGKVEQKRLTLECHNSNRIATLEFYGSIDQCNKAIHQFYLTKEKP